MRQLRVTGKFEESHSDGDGEEDDFAVADTERRDSSRRRCATEMLDVHAKVFLNDPRRAPVFGTRTQGFVCVISREGCQQIHDRRQSGVDGGYTLP